MQYATGSAIDRVIGMARFNTPTLHRLARDPNSTAQAAIVVGVVSIAMAVSAVNDAWVRLPLILLVGALVVAMAKGTLPGVSGMRNEQRVELDPRGFHHRLMRRAEGVIPVPGVIIGVTVAVASLSLALHIPALLVPSVAWFTFAGMASFLCNQIVGRPETQVEFLPLLRVTGFSLAPAGLVALAIVPVLGMVVLPIAITWTLLLLTFSISQTARLGTERALLATIAAAVGTAAVAGVMLAVLSL